MKVLFCSPYLKEQGVHRGGINIWADNILQYFQSLEQDEITITPISFDRRFYIGEHTGIIKRLYLGIKELSGAVKLAEVQLRSKSYDVIHICTSASMSLIKDILLIRLARRYGAKSVIHLHFGRTPELIKNKNWEWKLLKRVISSADSIITMDRYSYDALTALNFKNINYCPNPLSQEVIKQIKKEQGRIERSPSKLIFVGHVLRTKGVFELVEACKRHNDIELHIIGKAEDSIISELKCIAYEHNVGDWLKFRGEMSHEDVLCEMMSATMFVFPSYTEGFPNVILEAMACECPIASSDVGAIPEMLDIKKSPCGICYSPHSVDDVYKAVSELLNSTQLRELYAKRARDRVYHEYAVSNVWKLLSGIWLNIAYSREDKKNINKLENI